MTYEEWWLEFTSVHPDWRYADSEALRRAAFQAGAASRDAEVVSLTNQRDYEYVRAENAEQERDQLRAELETEQMRNAACGVVAMADTPDSAKQARDMHPDYMSASCSDVARRVDECIKLREQVKMLRDVLQFYMDNGICEPLYHKAKEALASTEPR